MTNVAARIRKSDGRLVRVLPDGREEVVTKRPIRPHERSGNRRGRSLRPGCAAFRSDARERSATDAAHPNAPPRSRPISGRIAARHHIRVGALRDWEQGRFEPDAAARAYLAVIARLPEMVRRVLEMELRSGEV
jgi:hypothetical protein